MDQCRCFRHQSLTAATARAKRLLAVTCLTMFLPFRDRPQTWVRPRKSKLVPSVSGWRAPSVICGRKSTRRVLSGWSVSPHRARRLPRTASTRLASTILSNAMIASLANWARVLSPLRRGLSRRRAPLFRSGLPLGGDCRLCSRRLLVFRLGGPRLRLVRLLRRRFGHLGFDGSRQLFSGRVGLVLRWAGWRVDGRFGRRLASLVPALRDLRLEPRLGGQPEPLRVALRPSFLQIRPIALLRRAIVMIRGDKRGCVPSQPKNALIGDCRSAALVGIKGSIDWLVWPRSDSAAVAKEALSE